MPRCEAQTESAAVGRGIMVLPAAGDAQVADLDFSAELGDLCSRHSLAMDGGKSRDRRDARSRRTAEACADREVAMNGDTRVVHAKTPRRRGSNRQVGGARLVYR